MYKLAALALAVVLVGLTTPVSADPINIADTIYVDDSDLTVWEEDNGLAGLQKEDTFDEEGVLIAVADSQVA